MEILSLDVMEPNEVVLEPNEVLLKRTAVESLWFCEHPDGCLLSFHNMYSIGYFWPRTANQQNRFFVVDLWSRKRQPVGRKHHRKDMRINKASMSKVLE
jgi:hypothetical protein